VVPARPKRKVAKPHPSRRQRASDADRWGAFAGQSTGHLGPGGMRLPVGPTGGLSRRQSEQSADGVHALGSGRLLAQLSGLGKGGLCGVRCARAVLGLTERHQGGEQLPAALKPTGDGCTSSEQLHRFCRVAPSRDHHTEAVQVAGHGRVHRTEELLVDSECLAGEPGGFVESTLAVPTDGRAVQGSGQLRGGTPIPSQLGSGREVLHSPVEGAGLQQLIGLGHQPVVADPTGVRGRGSIGHRIFLEADDSRFAQPSGTGTRWPAFRRLDCHLDADRSSIRPTEPNVTRQLAVLPLLFPLLTGSGCYLLKSASVDETCEDTPEGCGGAPADDIDGDGFSVDDGDCDDSNAEVHPSAVEVPGDGIDQDCDGSDGEALTDADGDGFFAEEDDCDDTNPDIHPDMQELCATPGIDDDCDGLIDDEDDNIDDTSVFYSDLDEDSYGNPDSSTAGCEPPESYVDNDTDCDDANSTVHPAANEICNNGIDDNCDGNADPCTWSGVVDPGSGTGLWLHTTDSTASYGFDVHDITGDGRPDGIFGVPSSGEWPTGAAVIMDHPPTNIIAIRNDTASEVIVGSSAEVVLGQTIEGIADVTANGYDDLLVSDSDGAYHLVEGPVRGGRIDEAFAHFVGLSANYETKGTLAADLNNDGRAELIIGYSSEANRLGDGYPGRLVAHEGPIAPGLHSVAYRALLDLEGPNDGSLFGYVALADDFNGDGIDELIVTAPFASYDGYGGAAIVLEGPPPTSWEDAPTFLLGDIDTAFGAELASGDLTGDGLPDLAVGAVYEQLTPTSYGTVHVFDSITTQTYTSNDSVAQISATGTTVLLGYSIEIGETDGVDGLGILMGAPQDYDDDLGRVVGFHDLRLGGTTSTDADFTISGATATSSFGYDMALVDMDGDGIDDLFTTVGDYGGVGFYTLPGL